MRTSLFVAALGVVCLPMLCANPANAQATRTWVSGVGDDVNPCSRTAPCKTFAGALPKTATGGIINCLDNAGYGAVTITKSITIDCRPFLGGVLAALTNGINVNAAGAVVHLRGLDIEGVGTGLIGINFINGAQLNVEDSKIFGFQSGSAMGIKFAPASGSNAKLHVMDTVISNNGSSASNGGIFVQPVGTGIAHVSLTRVQMMSNSVGLRTEGAGSTGQIRVSVRDSVAAGNTNSGIAGVSTGATTRIMISNSSSSNNSTGVLADGAGTQMILTGVTITQNDLGISTVNGALTFSYNTTNFINGNITTDGVPTNPTLTPH
jgi:hypothetical protein